MSYPAHVTDTVYRYDGTFQGFLCCILLRRLLRGDAVLHF